MMKGENAKKPLYLNQGFTWIAVVIIERQKSVGRKALWQMAGATGWPRITIGLDPGDNLRVWLSESSGKQNISEPLLGEAFLGKQSILIVSVIPENISSHPGESNHKSLVIHLESIGHGMVASRLNTGSETPLERFSIGANLDGEENTGFMLDRLTVFEGILSESDKIEILESLRKEYVV